jgi:beta-lactamase superfamily II metal-dependent hydrolase
LLLLALLYTAGAEAQFQSVRIQIIDRGQADGILIRTPNQRWIVIDAGTNRQQADAMRNSWGVDRVALAVVSHRHLDHAGGMDEILRDIPVDLFVGSMEDCPNRVFDDNVREQITAKGISVHPLDGNPIEIDGVRFTILPRDPVENECPDEENNNSVLVRMDFGDFSMLFTGDSETEQREWLMANHPDLLDVDVLKASHHGSRNGVDGTASGHSWLDVVSSQAIVISALLNSQFGHPHPEAVSAYEQAVGHDDVHCTSRHGTIRVYGRQDGTFSVFRQTQSDSSCAFGSP